jgi:hypothetical protein
MTAELALAADPVMAEQATDPAEFIIRACEQARTLLREALERGDIDQIAELKSRAEAIRVYTTQKRLSKESQLAAAELVRRAERGIGLAIRRGQREGSIRKHGSAGFQGNQHVTGDLTDGEITRPRPVTDFASQGELSGNRSGTGIYAITDGVSDEEFEGAIARAKQDGNLSRAHIARKLVQHHKRSRPGLDGERVPDPGDRGSAAAERRVELIRSQSAEGSTSRQIAGLLGIRDDIVRRIAREHQISIRADEVVGRTRRLDSNRIVRETANALEALATGAGLISPAELDKTQIPGWASSITASLRELNRLIKTLKEEMADDH